ncbi:DMT family transporter [Rothia nasimurium]|uniref:DMT family transporter n=1 Tax=Rothia nasimurium TaxID=85336 RepID=UPI003558A565
MATLAGMISLSLIVDKFGIFQAPQRPVRLVQVAGVVVIPLGVVLIRLTFRPELQNYALSKTLASNG